MQWCPLQLDAVVLIQLASVGRRSGTKVVPEFELKKS